MFLYIYFPNSGKNYHTAVLDSNFNVYWQASHIFKSLNLGSDVGKSLKRLLRGERVMRFKDITASTKCKNYCLTTAQVEIILSKVRQDKYHRNGEFEERFESIVSGRQFLIPNNKKKYELLLIQNPFLSIGISTRFVDKHSDGTFYQVLESLDHSYDNPSSVASSIYSECVPSPLPPPPPYPSRVVQVDGNYVFSLPNLVRYFKQKFSNSPVFGPPSIQVQQPPPPPPPASPMLSTFEPLSVELGEQQPPPPPSPSPAETEMEPPDSPQSTSFEPLVIVIPEEEPLSPAETERAPEQLSPPPEELDNLRETGGDIKPTDPPLSTDSFRMDVDDDKSFIFHDERFQTDYKFHALKVNWLSNPVSHGVYPFLKCYDDNHYFYFPVKKH